MKTTPPAPDDAHPDLGAVLSLLSARPSVDRVLLGPDPIATRRYDTKSVVPLAIVPSLMQAVPEDWQVVTSSGAALSTYSTIYFDTPDLRLFRDHRQGRLRRFKVRTRRYADGYAVLELKLKGPAGMTEKFRRDHHKHGALTTDDLEWIDASIRGRAQPRELSAIDVSAWTAYERAVLRSPDGSERVTIDLGLTVGVDEALNARARGAVIEVKSLAPRSRLTPTLLRLGARPDRLSKYAFAIASSHDTHANRWRPATRRLTDSR